MKNPASLQWIALAIALSFTSLNLYSQATFSGNVFLDQNNDGIQNGSDFGHGVISVMGYEDIDNNGLLSSGDVLLDNTLSDENGDYSLSLIAISNQYLIVLDSNSIDSMAITTVPETGVYVFPSTSVGSTGVDFAFYGETVYCYGFSENNVDAGLTIMNRLTGDNSFVGLTGKDRLEAAAIDTKTGNLYAAHLGQVGTVDRSSGAFTDLPNTAGEGDNGSGYTTDFTDLDGMTFDPFNGTLWVTHRIATQDSFDLLAQIDIVTGLIVQDAFGPNKDYVVIKDIAEALPQDIDDIAINPLTNELYGIANDSDSLLYDVLIKINKETGVATLVDTLKDDTGVYLDDVEGLSFTNQGILSASTGVSSTISPDAIFDVDPVTAVGEFKGTYEYSADYESCDCFTVSSNSASGLVFEDLDEDMTHDTGELGLAGVSIYVYLDMDGDGVIDYGSDPIVDSTDTDVDGNWTYNFGSNVDLLFEVNQGELPSGSTMTTDNLEEVLFENGIGGADDPFNNFGYISSVLPLDLLSFKADENDCFADLVWKTANEENFAYFQIERSYDGINFRTIVQIPGMGGQEIQNYSFKDRLAQARNFYRIKMVDIDGTINYSPVREVAIECSKFTSIALFPNPVSNQLGTLELEYFTQTDQTELVVSDLLGRTVIQLDLNTEAFTKNAYSLDISMLVPGSYSLRIRGNRYGAIFIVVE